MLLINNSLSKKKIEVIFYVKIQYTNENSLKNLLYFILNSLLNIYIVNNNKNFDLKVEDLNT
jgi:hypothetical protein